jgi:hypothetical protein
MAKNELARRILPTVPAKPKAELAKIQPTHIYGRVVDQPHPPRKTRRRSSSRSSRGYAPQTAPQTKGVQTMPTTLTQTTRTLTNDRGQSLDTDLTDEQAIQICRLATHIRSADFAKQLAQSLSNQTRPLSANQRFGIHKLALEEMRLRDKPEPLPTRQAMTALPAPRPQTPAPATNQLPPIPLGDYRLINKLFLTALHHNPRAARQARKAKQLKISFELPDGQTLRLSLATEASRYAVRHADKIIGPIFVTDGNPDFSQRKYFGRIDVDGNLRLDRNAEANGWTPDLEDLLRDFANDPQTVAEEWGHKTGRCIFCSRLLTDEEGDNGTQRGSSVEQGYGVVCARKFGLYHTSLTVAEKEAHSRRR